MSRPDGLIATSGNATMLENTQLINDWLENLGNDFQGQSAPPFVFDGMRWLDTNTSPFTLKVRRSGVWVPFGFGGFQDAPVVINTDWNNIETPGVCFFITNSGATPNTPGPSSAWVCTQTRRPDGTKVQEARRPTGTDYAVRRFTGGAWTPWDFVYSQRNAVGTVAQSGGIPTGAIIETGSSGSLRWTAWADGTLHRTFGFSAVDVNIAAGAIFRSNVFIPAIIGGPSMTSLSMRIMNGGGVWDGGGGQLFSAISRTNVSGTCLEIGRWF